MKVDAEVMAGSPVEASGLAKKAEDFGFDCFWVNETKHDPFLQLALAAASTSRISLGTSIALAFTRSPTTLAYTAWDLQDISGGRLILGLGSQVKGHVERRFGVKWEAPAPKMKEVVGALKAVWASWQEGRKLEFKGRFYSLDLMTPYFSPGQIRNPKIPVYIAAVNPGMCQAAGMVADGLHVHPLHTAKYLREVVEPALVEGASKAGRKRADLTIAASVFVAIGETREQQDEVRELFRSQVAFYASTRTYRKVLELHGWGDIGDALHEMSVRGEWEEMASSVSEEMLEEFVVRGTWKEVGGLLKKRYGGTVDRVRTYMPFDGSERWKAFVDGFTA